LSFVSLYLVAGVVLAGIASALLARLLPPRAATPVGALPQEPRRHAALQGFRGLLAFGVFMHHSFIWSRYARGHGWLDAALFHQFGESRVVLFYMLTATLFYGRLLDARGRVLARVDDDAFRALTGGDDVAVRTPRPRGEPGDEHD